MTTEPLSPGNPRIRDAAKLAQKAARRETGCLLIEGARLVADALAAGADLREVLITEAFQKAPRSREVLSLAGHIPITPISEAAAAKLSETRSPQGVFAVVGFRPSELGSRPLPERALVLVADGIGDPGNLGTMIRSAAAMGADAFIASGAACDLTNPKAVRATMGAMFRLPVFAEGALAEVMAALQSRRVATVAATARGGAAPWELDWTGPVAVLVGSEAEGLPPECVANADHRVTIPMAGGTESLNAAAGAAALLYEAARQRACRNPENTTPGVGDSGFPKPFTGVPCPASG